LFIGKIKEYNSQIYLTPEIVRVLDKPEWIELRKKELTKLYGERTMQQPKELKEQPAIEKELVSQEQSMAVEEEVVSDNINDNNRQKIIDSIEKLDSGGGADMLEVIENSKIGEDQANSIIQELLKEGEIFEIKSGKLKIIE
jgi:VIT1/CCC1 family predicted Fe2+/Mn2+ transporter